MKRMLIALVASAACSPAWALAPTEPAPYTAPFTTSTECVDYLKKTYGITPQREIGLKAEDTFLIVFAQNVSKEYVIGSYGGTLAGVCNQASKDLTQFLVSGRNRDQRQIASLQKEVNKERRRSADLLADPTYRYRMVPWLGLFAVGGMGVFLFLTWAIQASRRNSRRLSAAYRNRSSQPALGYFQERHDVDRFVDRQHEREREGAERRAQERVARGEQPDAVTQPSAESNVHQLPDRRRKKP